MIPMFSDSGDWSPWLHGPSCSCRLYGSYANDRLLIGTFADASTQRVAACPREKVGYLAEAVRPSYRASRRSTAPTLAFPYEMLWR